MNKLEVPYKRENLPFHLKNKTLASEPEKIKQNLDLKQ